jgi:hypothetical protein
LISYVANQIQAPIAELPNLQILRMLNYPSPSSDGRQLHREHLREYAQKVVCALADLYIHKSRDLPVKLLIIGNTDPADVPSDSRLDEYKFPVPFRIELPDSSSPTLWRVSSVTATFAMSKVLTMS